MCGIIAIVDNNLISKDKFIELQKKLQHRGQESFGLSFSKNDQIITKSFIGKINDNNIPFFHSNIIIGHNRYSTSGFSKKKNIEYEDNDNNNIYNNNIYNNALIF